METKQQVTKKFIIGVVLIIVSLLLGKLVLIPIFLFPGDAGWAMAMFWAYLCSWILIFIGMILAGLEGYKLAMHKYKSVKNRSVQKVKQHSKRAVKHVGRTSKNAARSVGRHSKNAAKSVGRTSKKAAITVGKGSIKAANKVKNIGKGKIKIKRAR